MMLLALIMLPIINDATDYLQNPNVPGSYVFSDFLICRVFSSLNFYAVFILLFNIFKHCEFQFGIL